MRTITEFAILALPILVLYLYMKKTNRWNEKTKRWLGIGGVIFVLGISFGTSYFFGAKRIGALFEKSEYTAKYFVLMFPDYDRAKNYKLPAEVEVTSEEDEERSYRCVYLRRVFFPNGNVVSFYCDESLEFEKKYLCFEEESSQEWGVELTRQKVE